MLPLQRRILPVCLAVLLVLPVMLSGCGSNKYAGLPEKLELMQQNVEELGPLCDSLVAIADWQINSAEEYWKEYDEAFAQGTEDQLPDTDNMEEVQAQHDILLANVDTLLAIESSYTAGEPVGVEQFDMTEQAYLACLADVRQSAEDMQIVFRYYFDVREALRPMEEYEPVESTTGYTDYSLIAGQMSQVISQTQTALEAVDYPLYMKDSHDKLIQRINEFQGLSQDLSEAVQLTDPLRMASWSNRFDRLSIMLNECSRELDEDFNLQFGQVRDRIEGRVATLRSEIGKNSQTLLEAIG